LLCRMLDWHRYNTVKFDTSELIGIATAKEFSYSRAQRFIKDHEVFTVQAIVMYLMAVFILKQFMNKRTPFTLDLPIRLWNITIAVLSGVCAAGMTEEFFTTLTQKGVNVALCSSSNTFFHGSTGYYLWMYHIIRLFEFTDTLFIILRKQPLLFIHWYHHALTLYVSWFSYARPSPLSRFGIYANSIIHTVMYTYFFLRASKVRLHPLFAKVITAAQILQFVLVFWSIAQPTVMKFALGMECELDSEMLFWSWFMDISYLYLFIDFYRSKYSEKKVEKQRKCE
ncbi:hypothetical protein PMAYCL1PPCAC_15223, partial [Pristionchus mayeri]